MRSNTDLIKVRSKSRNIRVMQCFYTHQTRTTGLCHGTQPAHFKLSGIFNKITSKMRQTSYNSLSENHAGVSQQSVITGDACCYK